jgi:hypothetical protein
VLSFKREETSDFSGVGFLQLELTQSKVQWHPGGRNIVNTDHGIMWEWL